MTADRTDRVDMGTVNRIISDLLGRGTRARASHDAALIAKALVYLAETIRECSEARTAVSAPASALSPDPEPEDESDYPFTRDNLVPVIVEAVSYLGGAAARDLLVNVVKARIDPNGEWDRLLAGDSGKRRIDLDIGWALSHGKKLGKLDNPTRGIWELAAPAAAPDTETDGAEARERKPGHSPSGIYSLKPSSELQLPPIEGELL